MPSTCYRIVTAVSFFLVTPVPAPPRAQEEGVVDATTPEKKMKRLHSVSAYPVPMRQSFPQKVDLPVRAAGLDLTQQCRTGPGFGLRAVSASRYNSTRRIWGTKNPLQKGI
jgi:hypothetical protein